MSSPESTTPPPGLLSRAARGATVLALRTTIVRTVSLAGNVVLARLLTPADFGILALGLTMATFGALFGTVGVGAAILRRPAAPSRIELQTVMTTSVVAGGALVAVAALLIPLFGEIAGLSTVMLLALPLYAARLPDSLSLERDLQYSALSRVEVIENVVGTVLSVGFVVAGAGVWGVAVALPLRTLVSTLFLWRVGPIGPLSLGFSRDRARALLGEGSTYAAHDVVGVVRDQVMNVVVGSAGGLGLLGAWALLGRIFTLPLAVVSAMSQVAFPAMSRAGMTAERSGTQIRRALALSSFALTVPVVLLVGTSQTLVPVAFGPGWDQVAATVPYSAAAILLGTPVIVAVGGQLFAERRGGIVVRTTLIEAAALIGAFCALAARLDLRAAGIASIVSAALQVLLLLRAVPGEGRAYLTATARPTVAGVVGGGTGLLVATVVHDDVAGLIAEAAASLGALLLCAALIARPALVDFVRVVAGGLGRGRQDVEPAATG